MRRFLPALLATTILAGCLPKPAWYSPAADLGALAGDALVRACRAGEPVACAELAGQIAAAGPGDPARETALYHLRIEACERGTDEMACERLGYDHVYAVWPNLAPLRTQAALVAACGREVGAACYLAGFSLPTELTVSMNSGGYQVTGTIRELRYQESIDVLGRISLPVRMAIKAFYTNPYFLRYMGQCELDVTHEGVTEHVSHECLVEIDYY